MIIGISGKKGVGKDTVATIIQYLVDSPEFHYLGNREYEYDYEDIKKELVSFIKAKGKVEYPDETIWENVKFADKIKDIVCLLIGCTREQLEDQKFKETPLGEKWTKYRCVSSYNNEWFNTEEEALKEAKSYYKYLLEKQGKYRVTYEEAVDKSIRKQIMTPRLLMQLIGTECGREIIHPDIWVNSLFADYKIYYVDPISKKHFYDINDMKSESDIELWEPDWIISDVRFPNEVKVIKEKKGLLIRINRFCFDSLEDYLVCYPDKEVSKKATKIVQFTNSNEELYNKLKEIPESKGFFENSHDSEIALDDYQEWDYIIDNTGSLEELIDKVKDILIKENLYE